MIEDRLRRFVNELAEIKDRYEVELGIMPEGVLLASKSQGRTKYYQGLKTENGYQRKGIASDPEMLKALARKEFLQAAIPIIEQNIATLSKANSKYRAFSPTDIAKSLAARKNLPEELFVSFSVDAPIMALCDSDEARIDAHAQWGSQPYDQSTYLPEGRTIITSRGLRVRSKAEAMIAEKLYEHGIAFRYEQVLWLANGTHTVPDFTFEGSKGSEFYLEFCGLMDNEEYVRKHHQKLDLYRANGIVPWENIIYVYAKGNTIDMMHIESVIKHQILAWL